MEYNENNPLRIFTSFSGYDSQMMALQRLRDNFPGFAFECVGWSEVDKNAILAHNALFPEAMDKNYGDISKIDWDKVPDFDLFTMSSPCFVKGTLILTDKGYKEIQDVKVGERVLTHKNRFCVVEKVGNKPSEDIYSLKSMVSPETICTGNHPFYVRKFRRVSKYIGDKYKQIREFSAPEWVEASNITKQCYLGFAVNTESKLPQWNGWVNKMWGHNVQENCISPLLNNPYFWYLMGRYVGDGWKRTGDNVKGIVICCGGRNEEKLSTAIKELGFNFTKVTERTVRKYAISRHELHEFVGRYGYYAHGKRIDGETLDLPVDLLRHFLDGILDSDGCYTQNTYKVTTVSRELVYGLAAVVAKVYKTHPRIYFCERPQKYEIEGREVNQRSTWTICWHTEKRKQDHAFYENGTVWFPIKEIKRLGTSETVYNIQVAEDHTYTANGIIVHNCQDFSMSGKRRGGEEGSGTRSSLLWECTRAIEIKRPRFVFFENVKGLITSKFIKGFHKWQARLEGLGYANFAQIMNASDYGVPQNRERVFMVSVLRNGETPKYYFPKKQRLDVRVKDLLERNVSEEYYLSEEALENFCSLGKGGEPLEGEWMGEDVEPILQCADGTSPTITASCGNMGAANLRDLGHFPIQGAMVKGDYHGKED